MSLILTAAALAIATCGGAPVTNCRPPLTFSEAMASATPQELTIDGPGGTLAGTLIDGDPNAPALLLLPGSGPTDRDGNSPMGVRGSIYAQLASGLQGYGVATIRADKRGIGGSKGSGDPNAVTIADYVADAARWRDQLIARGHRCVWLAGHSEGGLIALALAAERPGDLCGVILIAAPGRRMDAILKAQLARQLPPEAMRPVSAAIDRLASGQRVDPATVPDPLRSLFAPQIQGYLMDMMRHDPAALAARVRLPMLIVQGEEDLQVTIEDAKALHAAQPAATLALLPGTNHVLKAVKPGDATANVASYSDASAPIAPDVVAAIVSMIARNR